MRPDVVFRRSAEADLDAIFEHIAADSLERAIAYVRRIRSRCEAIDDFPESGTPRPGLGLGFRTIAFERRVLIVYVAADAVEIVRVLYGGRDVEALLSADD